MATKLKTRNNNTMTEAAFFGLLRNILRIGFKRRWIPLQVALQKARRPSQNLSNKRQKWEYQCANCKEWFKGTEVEIDHVIPCGSLRCWEDVVPFIQKLTAEGEGAYQILCLRCNDEKAKEEIKQRKLDNGNKNS